MQQKIDGNIIIKMIQKMNEDSYEIRKKLNDIRDTLSFWRSSSISELTNGAIMKECIELEENI